MLRLIFASWIKRCKPSVDLRSSFDLRFKVLHQALDGSDLLDHTRVHRRLEKRG